MSVAGLMLEWAAGELLPALVAEFGSRALQRAAVAPRGATDPQVRLAATPGLSLLPSHRVVATTPGRARVHVTGLRNNRTAAEIVERRLEDLDGVIAVRASSVTGNVLVEFDEERVTLQRIQIALRTLHRPGANRVEPGLAQRSAALALVRE